MYETVEVVRLTNNRFDLFPFRVRLYSNPYVRKPKLQPKKIINKAMQIKSIIALVVAFNQVAALSIREETGFSEIAKRQARGGQGGAAGQPGQPGQPGGQGGAPGMPGQGGAPGGAGGQGGAAGGQGGSPDAGLQQIIQQEQAYKGNDPEMPILLANNQKILRENQWIENHIAADPARRQDFNALEADINKLVMMEKQDMQNPNVQYERSTIEPFQAEILAHEAKLGAQISSDIHVPFTV